MTVERAWTFGVQLDAESNQIVAGRMNKAQDALLAGKEDVTDMAVLSVAEYVVRNFDGAAEIEYEDGITYQIQVVKIGQRHPNGARYGLYPGGVIAEYQ